LKTELVTNLKRQATKIIADLGQSPSPILITQHGKEAAYLLSVYAFEKLEKRMQLLEGIARGEKAIEQGRVTTHVQAKKKMKRWLK
jgi:prevent-host-death family protein